MDCTYARVRKVFAAAIELGPEERRVFLEQACEGDDELLKEVESLLGFHRSSDRDDP